MLLPYIKEPATGSTDTVDINWGSSDKGNDEASGTPDALAKVLFVDTLKEIFEGNEKLFEGLYIHDKWDWGRKFPVIKIDFADGV